MSVSFIENKELDANNLEDINSVIANCEVYIGNLPSRLIPIFRKYFPNADISWNLGCKNFRINGIWYEQYEKYYWMNDAPRFYRNGN